MTTPHLYLLDDAQHATVMAALRVYQNLLSAQPKDQNFLTPATNSVVHDIATNCGTVKPLTSRQIDALCENLNHPGLTFGQIAPLFAEPDDNPYVVAARADDTLKDADVSFDDAVVISKDEDTDGAHVLCWAWVSDSDLGAPGLEHGQCEKCDADLEPGHSSGTCDDCSED